MRLQCSSFTLCACRVAITSLGASCWLLCVWSQFFRGFSIFQPPSFTSASSVCLQFETRQRRRFNIVPIHHCLGYTTTPPLASAHSKHWMLVKFVELFCLYLLDWSYCLNSHLNTVCSLLSSDCKAKIFETNFFYTECITHVYSNVSLN